jgi:hypothetical protein
MKTCHDWNERLAQIERRLKWVRIGFLLMLLAALLASFWQADIFPHP